MFKINFLKIVFLQNFAKKQECRKLRQKVSYLSIFELKFKKIHIIFRISTLKFVYLQKLAKKKCLNIGPKVKEIWVGIVGIEFQTAFVILEISTIKVFYLQNSAKN